MKGGYWLSGGMLVLSYATFGQWLHGDGVQDPIWWATVAFVVVTAGILTWLWPPVRTFLMLGFQSDAGYSIMVLMLASFAVLAVVQFRAFAYVIVLVATSLLVRVDCLIHNLGDRRSFLLLMFLPLLGLGLSWLPSVLHLLLHHDTGTSAIAAGERLKAL